MGRCPQGHRPQGVHAEQGLAVPVVHLKSWFWLLNTPSVNVECSSNKCFFLLQVVMCTQKHTDKGVKILTTFGFPKYKRMTKIKHQKKSSWRSDSLENETEQRYILQKWLSMSLHKPLFSHLNFAVGLLFLKQTLYLLDTAVDVMSRKHIDFLCFSLLTASSVFTFL